MRRSLQGVWFPTLHWHVASVLRPVIAQRTSASPPLRLQPTWIRFYTTTTAAASDPPPASPPATPPPPSPSATEFPGLNIPVEELAAGWNVTLSDIVEQIRQRQRKQRYHFIALDVGDRYVGVARTIPEFKLAMPITQLHRFDNSVTPPRWKSSPELVKELTAALAIGDIADAPDAVIVGVPVGFGSYAKSVEEANAPGEETPPNEETRPVTEKVLAAGVKSDRVTGSQSRVRAIQEFVLSLRAVGGFMVPVVFWDESFTTEAAVQFMRNENKPKRSNGRRRGSPRFHLSEQRMRDEAFRAGRAGEYKVLMDEIAAVTILNDFTDLLRQRLSDDPTVPQDTPLGARLLDYHQQDDTMAPSRLVTAQRKLRASSVVPPKRKQLKTKQKLAVLREAAMEFHTKKMKDPSVPLEDRLESMEAVERMEEEESASEKDANQQEEEEVRHSTSSSGQVELGGADPAGWNHKRAGLRAFVRALPVPPKLHNGEDLPPPHEMDDKKRYKDDRFENRKSGKVSKHSGRGPRGMKEGRRPMQQEHRRWIEHY